MLSMTGSTEPVSYTYDALYRVSSLTDGNGHATHYYWKQRGYLDAVTYPGYSGPAPVYNSSTDSYSNITGADSLRFPSYDADGNLTQRIDGRSVTTNYSYTDPESQLTDIQYPASSSINVHLHYDSYGRRDSMTDGTGSQAYAYDDLDALTSDTTTYTGLTAKTISYGFYPDGSRESMSTPAGSFSYSYDGDGRMVSLTNPYSETSSWTYLDNNWLKTQTLGNGVTTTYTRNAWGQLLGLLTKTSGGATLSEFSVPNSNGYDGVGNLRSMTASIPGAPASYSGTTNYSYDNISGVGTRSQLTQEVSGRGGGYTNNFAYDGGSYVASTGAGNPTTFRSAGTNAFDADNQATTFYGSGGASLGAFAYDGNGDPTTDKGQTLTFDPESRMTSYGAAETCAYNGDGLRAEKVFQGGAVYYLYDGNQPIIELDGSGNASAVHTFGANGLLSRRSGGATTFYTFDLSGNTAEELNSSSGVLDTSLVDSFGITVNTSGSTDPYVGFGAQWGYYYDSQTGLDLLGYRYYDPAQGRFLTPDAIGYDGGVNLYGYTGNNPVNRGDPKGQFPGFPGGGGILGGIIGGALGIGIVASLPITGPIILAGGLGGVLLGAAAGAVGGAIMGGIFGGIGRASGDTTESFTTGAISGALAGGMLGGVMGGFPDTWGPPPGGWGGGETGGDDVDPIPPDKIWPPPPTGPTGLSSCHITL